MNFGSDTLGRKVQDVSSNVTHNCKMPVGWRALIFLPSRVGKLNRYVVAEGIISLTMKKVSRACPRGHETPSAAHALM